MAMHQVQLQAGLSMHHRIDDRSCIRGGPSWAAMPRASGPAQAHSSVESCPRPRLIPRWTRLPLLHPRSTARRRLAQRAYRCASPPGRRYAPPAHGQQDPRGHQGPARRAAKVPRAQAIVEQDLNQAQSFDPIERARAAACPDLESTLIPRRVPCFTVRAACSTANGRKLPRRQGSVEAGQGSVTVSGYGRITVTLNTALADQTLHDALARHGRDPHALLQLLIELQQALGWLPRRTLSELAGALGMTLGDVESVAGFYRFLHLQPVGRFRILFSRQRDRAPPGQSRADGQPVPAPARAARRDARRRPRQRRTLLVHRAGRPGAFGAGQPHPGRDPARRGAHRPDGHPDRRTRCRCRGLAGRMVARGRRGAARRRAAGTARAARRGACALPWRAAPMPCWPNCRPRACAGAAVPVFPPPPSGRRAAPPGDRRGRVQRRRRRTRHLQGPCAASPPRRRAARRHGHRRFRASRARGLHLPARRIPLAAARAAGRARAAARRACWARPSWAVAASTSTSQVHLGAGAYVCGEESALIESLEGGSAARRASARPSRQNAATWGCRRWSTTSRPSARWRTSHAAAAPGGPASARAQSTGTKIHSVSGDCERPGLYEYPWARASCRVLEDCGARDTQAVQVGGPVGGVPVGLRVRPPAGLRGRAERRRLHGLRPLARPVRGGARLRRLLRARELRLLHPLPRGHAAGAAAAGQAGRRRRLAPRHRRAVRARPAAARRHALRAGRHRLQPAARHHRQVPSGLRTAPEVTALRTRLRSGCRAVGGARAHRAPRCIGALAEPRPHETRTTASCSTASTALQPGRDAARSRLRMPATTFRTCAGTRATTRTARAAPAWCGGQRAPWPRAARRPRQGWR
jgi:hypothetical protein